MEPRPLLETRGLRKNFGGVIAADGVDLTVAPGEIHAVIGPNGAGKTTLVNLLSGRYRPDAGEIRFDGRPVTRLSAAARARRGLARSFQITSIFLDFSVVEYVMLAAKAREPRAFRIWRPVAAPRSAQEPRIKAAISAGGCFDFGDLWDSFPSGVHEALGYGYGAKDAAEARAIAQTFTLKGVKIDCPLLVVHSGQDTVCPVEESEKIAAVAGSKAEMVIYPEGNHVCDNIPYKVRPLMADWMADKLGA